MAEKHKLVSQIKDDYFRYMKNERLDLEDTWNLAYDAFRGMYSSGNLKKWKALEGSEWRSKVFVRLTKVKVVAAISQIEDIYFQGGKLPYNLNPTPVPETAPGFFLDPVVADQRCKRMKLRLDDLLVQGKFERKLMGALLEKAVYGMTVHKCPVIRPISRMGYELFLPQMSGINFFPNTELLHQFGRHRLNKQNIMTPTVEHPNLWDIFWDMEYENPHEGQGIVHRVKMSPGMLWQYADREGYDKEAIKRAVKNAGENSASGDQSDPPGQRNLQKRRRNIEVIEWNGRVDKACLKDTPMEEYSQSGREVEIFTVLAGDEIIRPPVLMINPMGIRPYNFSYWENIPHESKGVGIPENVQDSQMMVNSGVRCFIDNKAISGNVLMAGNPRNLAPGQNRSVYPGKFFELAEHIDDYRHGIQFFSPPDVGRGLMELVNLFRNFADEEANLPRLVQGESSKSDPKTAFAFSRLIMNANKQLGKVIRNTDEGLVEPDVENLYHWEMATNPDENIKGDFRANATGFSSFQDQVMRGQNLQNYLLFALSNKMLALMVKPMSFMREIAMTRDIDPDEFLVTDDEFEGKAAQFLSMLTMPGSPMADEEELLNAA